MANKNIVKSVVSRESGAERLKSRIFEKKCKEFNLTHLIGGEFSMEGPDSINCVDFDGKRILGGCKQGRIIQFNTESSKYYDPDKFRNIFYKGPMKTHGPIETIRHLPYSHGLFLTGGKDKEVIIWDSNSLTNVEEFQMKNNVEQVAVSPVPGNSYGIVAVSLMGENVKLLDIKSGSFVHELQGMEEGSLSCAWSTRYDYLIAAGGLNSTVKLWDFRSSKYALSKLFVGGNLLERDPVNGVIFTPDGNRLVTSCKTVLSSWNTINFRKFDIKYERFENPYFAKPLNFDVASSGNLDVCFVPENRIIVLFNIKTGQIINSLIGHFGRCNGVAYDVNRMELYSGGSEGHIVHWSSFGMLDLL